MKFTALLVAVTALITSPVLAVDCSALKDRPGQPLRPQDLDKMKQALDGGMNANAPAGQYSLLMFAAGDGDVALTRLLLSRGARTEHRDQNKDRALLWAAKRGRAETVRLLLDAGSPPDSDEDPYGSSPLMNAARNGHAATVCLLLNRGADISKFDQSGHSALHEAVLGRDISIVSLLLESGANPRATSKSLEETPLHQAVTYGTPEMVRLLVGAGAGLEARNSEGRTALWQAAFLDRPEAADVLLASGADPDARARSGESAFVAAARKSGVTARVLVERTNDLDAGFAAAIWGGHADLARRLFERGASVNAVDVSGLPALAGASRHEGLAMLEWLLAQKASLPDHGAAALHEAARAGRGDIAQRLLSAGARVNGRIADGATALLAAAHAGHADVARLLLENAADRRVRDHDGRDIEAYMNSAVDSIRSQITSRRGSRAYKPTHDLEATLQKLTTAHAEVRAMISELNARPCASATPCPL